MTDLPHGNALAPSPWVVRFAPLIPAGGRVLDLACGGGRHARWLAARGWAVDAVDRDAEALAPLAATKGVATQVADLEGERWPVGRDCYDGVVVTNYLFRPRLSDVLAALKPGGILIYETFMCGNERFGRPSNPDFLLREGELLEVLTEAGFTLAAFEQGNVTTPRAATIQRACGVRGPGRAVTLPDR